MTKGLLILCGNVVVGVVAQNFAGLPVQPGFASPQAQPQAQPGWASPQMQPQPQFAPQAQAAYPGGIVPGQSSLMSSPGAASSSIFDTFGHGALQPHFNRNIAKPFAQCDGKDKLGHPWRGPRGCPPGYECEHKDENWSMCSNKKAMARANEDPGIASPYSQCAGKDKNGKPWNGPKRCPDGWRCVAKDPYYSQCKDPWAGYLEEQNKKATAPPTLAGAGFPQPVAFPQVGGFPQPAALPQPAAFSPQFALQKFSNIPSVIADVSSSTAGAMFVGACLGFIVAAGAFFTWRRLNSRVVKVDDVEVCLDVSE